jgi:hypothetical protein
VTLGGATFMIDRDGQIEANIALDVEVILS